MHYKIKISIIIKYVPKGISEKVEVFMNKKKKLIICGILAAVIIAVVATILILIHKNQYYIELNVATYQNSVFEYGDGNVIEKPTAVGKGTIFNKKGTALTINQEGEVDYDTLGHYTINYSVSYEDVTLTAVHEVDIIDTEAPVIELVTDPDAFTSPIAAYEEEGYSATDNYDGDITAKVESVEHDGVVTYVVRDSSGNQTTVDRKIVYNDVVPPVLILNDSSELTLECGTAYVEPGFVATDDVDGNITSKVVTEGSVDSNKVGTYTLTYSVKDGYDNEATANRTITVVDTAGPVITLNDGNTINIQPGSVYEEPGFKAVDCSDGDVSGNVTVTGEVDGETIGTYKITYAVSDSFGNATTVERTVTVKDTIAPKLTVSSEEKVFVAKDSEFEMPEYSAVDTLDGDLTEAVTVSGSVDIKKIGIYVVNYTVSDAAGNEAKVTITFYVYNPQEGVPTVDPGDKVIYLTFDDGPGPYTEKLLDILDKYNVKVTFFVTNQYPAYQDMIAEEYKRGHTVAIHSYSHDYATVYASETAFFNDIQKMSDICEAQTGVAPTIIRFPGGSSNTVSRRYCNGIMSTLTKSVGKMGYKYADWNVTSGDAGETTSTAQVIANIKAGCKSNKVSVVLQHDIKNFSVDAVEDVIVWGLTNGYTFLPMDETSPMAHHGVNN